MLSISTSTCMLVHAFAWSKTKENIQKSWKKVSFSSCAREAHFCWSKCTTAWFLDVSSVPNPNILSEFWQYLKTGHFYVGILRFQKSFHHNFVQNVWILDTIQNLTIWQPNNYWPFEYRTCWIFRSPLYVTVYQIYPCCTGVVNIICLWSFKSKLLFASIKINSLLQC